jgi:pimeloyl-ACP methyl ester carboxylesterase
MQFFASEGVRIAYIDLAPASGAGDPVLLIHGWLLWASGVVGLSSVLAGHVV